MEKDEEVRPLVRVSILTLFGTAWHKGHLACNNLSHLSPKILFWNEFRKNQGGSDYPDLPGKLLLKWKYADSYL